MPSFKTLQFGQPLRGVRLRGGSGAVEADAAAEAAQRMAALEAQWQAKVKAAEKEGYTRGLAEGRKAEKAAVEAAQAKQAQQIAAIMKSLESERLELVNELQAVLPELILEGVARILHGWEPDAETLQKIVHGILAGYDGEDKQSRLSLNPEDLALLKDHNAELEVAYPGLRIIEDGRLQRGECLLEGRFGVTDERHSAKLENLKKVLE